MPVRLQRSRPLRRTAITFDARRFGDGGRHHIASAFITGHKLADAGGHFPAAGVRGLRMSAITSAPLPRSSTGYLAPPAYSTACVL